MKQTLIDAETGNQLPQEESAGTQSTTPTMAVAARPAAISPPEPENLLPAKRRGELECLPGKQQLTCQDLKVAIHNQLAIEDNHSKAAGVAALRSGVLFHLYKQQATEKGEAFWAACESEFKVNRATISKKMRIAVIWAKEKGADEATIMALANAADITDGNNPAVQLCFAFLGDDTITDIYRKYKLIAPAPIGGDTTKYDADGNPVHLSKAEQEAILNDAANEQISILAKKIAHIDNDTLARTKRVHLKALKDACIGLKKRLSSKPTTKTASL